MGTFMRSNATHRLTKNIPEDHSIVKRAIVFLYSIVVLAGPFSLLEASSFLMGDVRTVCPYGAQDATRSPALITRTPTGNAFGVNANYTFSAQTKMRIRSAEDLYTSIPSSVYDSYVGQLSYIRKIQHAAVSIDYGVGFENKQGSTRSLFNDIVPALWGVSIDSKSDQNISYFGIISAAYSVTSHHAIGIQAAVYYRSMNSTVRNKRYATRLPLPPPEQWSQLSNINKKDDIGIMPSIGYHATILPAEFGIVISPGVFGWRKEKRSRRGYLIHDWSIADITDYSSGSLPFESLIVNGPSLTAGALVRTWGGTATCLEFEINLPSVSRPKTLVPVGPFMFASSKSMQTRITIKSRPSFSLRGGFEIPINSTMKAGLGAGFSYHTNVFSVQAPLSPDPFDIHYHYNSSFTIFGTAGMDVIAHNNTFTLGTKISYFRQKNESTLRSIETFDQELHNDISKTKLIILQLFVIVSAGF